MNANWDKVANGRYALKHGHDVLQVMFSPDHGSDDKRPYIAIVDKKPLPRRYWTLREAKCGALDAAGVNGHGRMQKETTFGIAMHAAEQRRSHELLDKAAAELLPPKPSITLRRDSLLAAVRELEQHEPEPLPEPAEHADDGSGIDDGVPICGPEPLAAVSRVSIALPHDLAAADAAAMLDKAAASVANLQEIMALMVQAQAAVQLLTELGVSCRLELPQGISL